MHFGEFSPAQIFLFRPGEDLMTGPQPRECFRRVDQKHRDQPFFNVRIKRRRERSAGVTDDYLRSRTRGVGMTNTE